MHNNENNKGATAFDVVAAILVALTIMVIGIPAFIVFFDGDAYADAVVTRAPMRPCLSDEGESAFPCVWMASVMGNHRGHSFRIYRDGRVKLISEARAFELLGECDSDGPLYCKAG